MIFSRSAQYAIRATIHLVHLPDGHCALARDIAAAAEVPAPFLSKILQELARKGLLRSLKGPSGGFCLKKKATEIRLLDLVAAVDGLGHFGQCVAGFSECSAKTACPLHDSWIPLQSRIMEYLEQNTVGSLAESFDEKQRGATKRMRKPRESQKALRTSL